MKHPTVVDGQQLGSFEDSRGYVGAYRLRAAYREATKLRRRALRAADENENPERQSILDTELTAAEEQFSLAQLAITRYQG